MNTAEKFISFARKITPSAHAQATVLGGMIIVGALFYNFYLLAAIVVYVFLHLCYGDGGAYRTPLRANKKPGVLDILLVTLGTLALLGVVGGTLWLIAQGVLELFK